MSFVSVRNVNGTSDRMPSDGSNSWKEFWEKHTGRIFSKCANNDCNSKAEVGAHVKHYNSYINVWYITPLCKSCNAIPSTEAFKVDSDDLVRVVD